MRFRLQRLLHRHRHLVHLKYWLQYPLHILVQDLKEECFQFLQHKGDFFVRHHLNRQVLKVLDLQLHHQLLLYKMLH
jgi:hypothetical protein